MVRNARIGEADFLEQRKAFLGQWPTGRDVDLEEAVGYHRDLAPEKNMVNRLQYAKQHDLIYASTGMGKTTIDAQIALYQHVEREGQADLLGLSPDSITRQNDYEKAELKWRNAGRRRLY
jgi:methylaspartate mutase epsilon subunit